MAAPVEHGGLLGWQRTFLRKRNPSAGSLPVPLGSPASARRRHLRDRSGVAADPPQRRLGWRPSGPSNRGRGASLRQLALYLVEMGAWPRTPGRQPRTASTTSYCVLQWNRASKRKIRRHAPAMEDPLSPASEAGSDLAGTVDHLPSCRRHRTVIREGVDDPRPSCPCRLRPCPHRGARRSGHRGPPAW